MIQPIKIEQLSPKRFAGFTTETSIVNNQTAVIWKQLMPRRNEIESPDSSKKYSLQVFPKEMTLLSFNPTTVFQKWALIELKPEASIPDGMVEYQLAGGKYAVFEHHGLGVKFPETLQAILGEWLPSSGFQLDTERPHFEVLDERYLGLDNPNSMEEIWIPIN